MLDATERNALTLTTFTAACICFAPAQIVSGVALLIASVLIFRWDQRVSRREAAATSPVTVGETPEPATAAPAAEPPADAA
jgi:hypothetical protein